MCLWFVGCVGGLIILGIVVYFIFVYWEGNII